MTPPPHRDSAQLTLWALGLLLLLALLLAGGWQCRALADHAAKAGAAAVPDAVLTTTIPVQGNAGATAAGSPPLLAAASVRIEERDAAVIFYFAEDQVQLPADAAKSLGPIVKGVAAGQTAVIQVFQPSHANPGQTTQRVLSVHNLLVSVGIGEDKIRRAEPEPLPAWARADGADRVEVVLDAG